MFPVVFAALGHRPRRDSRCLGEDLRPGPEWSGRRRVARASGRFAQRPPPRPDGVSRHRVPSRNRFGGCDRAPNVCFKNLFAHD